MDVDVLSQWWAHAGNESKESIFYPFLFKRSDFQATIVEFSINWLCSLVMQHSMAITVLKRTIEPAGMHSQGVTD